MAPLPSPKTETGLEQLNELLAGKSYLTGSSQASQDDFNVFFQIQRVPDRSQYPHLCRWHQHIASLRQRYAGAGGLPPWLNKKAEAGASKKRLPGKEKKELEVDCKALVVEPLEARRVLLKSPPDLGCAKTNLPGSKSGRQYYITTAISYSNGWPHIGHGYEALTSDAFARFHRLMGEDVFFMTGTDEHGAKIAQAAEDAGMTPIESCDRYAIGFQALNQRLLISSDFFVRTTADRHKEVARAMWNKCKEAGDIYLDRYEGWYLTREERFITEQEAQEWNYKDPGSGVPLKKMSEPSFFFRLSKFQERVMKHIEDNQQFIQPQQYRTEIMERLKGLELRDLSISRGTFSWGVPCPEDPVDGNKHVMYVWFDALINYISGIDGLDPKKPLSRFWPADMHIVGKDISWFHTVIWPAMLMSAGVPLPKSVVVHGFISGVDGRKMSKTFGNGIDPHDPLDEFSVDTLRWYLCREASYGDDVKFSVQSLKLMHNSELCDNLGNLVQRAVALCAGKVPECEKGLVGVPFNLKELKVNAKEHFEKFRLADGASCAIQACAATNKWIADLEPWKMKDESEQKKKAATCRILLEAVYTLAHFFAPFIPTAAEAIFKKVGTPPRSIPQLSDEFLNLKAGSEVVSGSILFAQIDVQATPATPAAVAGGGDAPAAKAAAKAGGKDAKGDAAAAKAKAKAGDKAKEGGEKKEAQQQGGGKKKKKEIEEDNPDQPLFSKLDIRVGKVVSAENHPQADRLFVEQIDVGDPEGPRTVISGLREHYSLEEFTGKKLLAVCNLMGAKMQGVTSHGMVLCAKTDDKTKVELISVPDDVPIGTRVLPEGVPSTWAPQSKEAVDKYKIWAAVAAELRTASDKTACFAGKPLVTEKGVKFLAPTCSDTIIS